MTMYNKKTETSSESHDSDSFSDFYKAYGNRTLEKFVRDERTFKPRTIADLKIQAIVAYLQEVDERLQALESMPNPGGFSEFSEI